jgi:hypothetical protein
VIRVVYWSLFGQSANQVLSYQLESLQHQSGEGISLDSKGWWPLESLEGQVGLLPSWGFAVAGVIRAVFGLIAWRQASMFLSTTSNNVA